VRFGVASAVRSASGRCGQVLTRPAGRGIGFVWYDWGDQGYGFCTATLITETVVLTAAHCIQGPIAGFYTGTGEPSDLDPTPVAGMVKHEVTAWATHPAYDWKGGCPNTTPDVALVRLAAPLAGIAPLPITTTSQMPAAGTACTAIGFGTHTENGTDTYEQKRSGTVGFVDSTSTAAQVTFVTAIADAGDSGGPLICNGAIIGATSCHSDGDFPQHKNEYYARVDAANEWIATQIAAWH